MYITTIYRKIKYGIKNFWLYKNIIWNDRWYDYCFFYRLMEFKLNLMADNFEDHGNHEDSDKEAKDMRTAASLCRRIANGSQCELEWENYTKDFPTKFKFVQCEDNRHLSQLVIEPKDPLREAEADRIYKLEQELMNQDLDQLGKILKDKSLSWWD